MEDSVNQHAVFIELRERLQSGVLIIRADVVTDTSTVNVSSGDSALRIHVPDGVYEVQLPPEVRLVDGSCQKSPELNADGLHVRVRLKVGRCSEAQASAVHHLRAQRSYCFCCQRCGAVLIADRVFQRVLPLPNGNWNSLVDDWCCHADPFANKKLHPQEKDCLVGDTSFLLTWDGGCDRSLTRGLQTSLANTGADLPSVKQEPGHGDAVACTNCRAALGERVTTEVLKFYITEVVGRQSDDGANAVPQSRQQFLERTLSSRLVDLSSAQSIFRFSIQTPDGKSAVMLWLLNMDTLMASFPDEALSSDILASSGDRHPNKHRSGEAVRAIKVLYLVGSRARPDAAIVAWEKDISVHPLILPWITCMEVLQLLSSSTNTLPSSMRSMNCYKVAYLRR